MKNFDAISWHKILHQLGRFAPSFVRQPNGPECTQIVRNAPKRQFKVQWGGSDAFVVKNSDATSWHKLLHYFGPFCTEFRKATKRSRMHPNSTKCTKTSVYGPMWWIGCVRCEKFQRDIGARTFCTSSVYFAMSFVMQPYSPECTQIIRNAPKHQFRVQWGGSGVFVAKNSDATSWHELLH